MCWDVCCSCGFFFKQKTAYEMRVSDWSSDVCSSDLAGIKNVAKQRRTGKVGIAPQRQPPAQPGGGHHAHLAAEQVLGPHALPGAVAKADVRIDVATAHATETGRASCRERVCQYV